MPTDNQAGLWDSSWESQSNVQDAVADQIRSELSRKLASLSEQQAALVEEGCCW